MTNFFLIFFSSLLFILSYYTIIIQNPINALFSLISCFFVFSVLLLYWGFDFFAMLVLMIYLGAVAVLFLIVLFFINIPFILKSSSTGDFFGFFLVFCCSLVFFSEVAFFNSFTFIMSDYCLGLAVPENLLPVNYKQSALILCDLLYNSGQIFVIYTGILLYITLTAAIYLLIDDDFSAENYLD